MQVGAHAFCDCAEFVHTAMLLGDEDSKIAGNRPEVDEMEFGAVNSIAYAVKVAGKNMQADFEPVIERKIHNTSTIWKGDAHRPEKKVSVSALTHYEAGFRIKHIGEVCLCI